MRPELPQLQDIAGATILGRPAGAAGPIQQLTAAQAQAIIGVSGGGSGLSPLNFGAIGHSLTEHTGNGSQTTFSYPFNATTLSQVAVSTGQGIVDLLGTHYNFTPAGGYSVDLNSRTITFTAAPQVGVKIRIEPNDDIALDACFDAAKLQGKPVDGGKTLFGTADGVQVADWDDGHIVNLRLKQLHAESDSITLDIYNCNRMVVDRLYVHLGDSPMIGHMDYRIGLRVRLGERHLIRNVEATGSAICSAIQMSKTFNSVLEDAYVHDVRFWRNDPYNTNTPAGQRSLNIGDDTVQGIHNADNEGLKVVRPRVLRLFGNGTTLLPDWSVVAWPPHMTRGLAGGGNIDCQIIDPYVRLVDQGCDMSGSGGNWGNRDCEVRGGYFIETGHAVKWANAQEGNRVIGVTGKNGTVGFIGGSGNGAPYDNVDQEIIDCKALNPGYLGMEFGFDNNSDLHAGVLISGASGGTYGWRVITTKVIDNMGFFLAGDDAGDDGGTWPLPGATSTIMHDPWGGPNQTRSCTFNTTAGAETRMVALTFGSKNITWSGGLSNKVDHPFVKMPTKLKYGFAFVDNSGDALNASVNGRVNFVDATSVSIGHLSARTFGV